MLFEGPWEDRIDFEFVSDKGDEFILQISGCSNNIERMLEIDRSERDN